MTKNWLLLGVFFLISCAATGVDGIRDQDRTTFLVSLNTGDAKNSSTQNTIHHIDSNIVLPDEIVQQTLDSSIYMIHIPGLLPGSSRSKEYRLYKVLESLLNQSSLDIIPYETVYKNTGQMGWEEDEPEFRVTGRNLFADIVYSVSYNFDTEKNKSGYSSDGQLTILCFNVKNQMESEITLKMDAGTSSFTTAEEAEENTFTELLRDPRLLDRSLLKDLAFDVTACGYPVRIILNNAYILEQTDGDILDYFSFEFGDLEITQLSEDTIIVDIATLETVENIDSVIIGILVDELGFETTFLQSQLHKVLEYSLGL